MLIELIQEICQHPLNNPQRRKLMNKLLIIIQNSPQLRKSHHPNFLDALNKTFDWLNRNLCSQFNYHIDDPETSLLQWINSHLYWRIKDLYYVPFKDESLDKIIDSENQTTLLELLSANNINTPSLNGLDQLIADIEKQEKNNLYQQLERAINEDREEILIKCHPKNHPQCNCQFLVKRLFLQEKPDQFSTLAKELNINYQTLNSHWKRNCLTRLKTIAQAIGYEHE